MRPFFSILALCSWLALSAWSQTTTFPPPPPPLFQIRQFLSLTEDQVSAILQNNDRYNRFSFQLQDAIRHAQAQISVETARDPLDPMALGTLYAGIESACRELRDQAATSQKQNISILTDAQKAKLKALDDAMKLAPTISEAQFANLLGSPNSQPYVFNAYSTSITGGVIGFGFLPPPGCNVAGNFGIVIDPATGASQPGVAGVNRWFDRPDPLRKSVMQPQ